MYDVALLFERQLTHLDADQVVALHEGLDDTVRYHLLLPVDMSASMLASSMSALGGGQIMTIADADMIADVQNELSSAGQAELNASAALLTSRGQEVTRAHRGRSHRRAQRAGGHDVVVGSDHPH